MARFQIWSRARGAREEKLAEVDLLGPAEDRKVRRALRSSVDVLVVDTAATTDPGARYSVLIAGRTDPEPSPDGEV